MKFKFLKKFFTVLIVIIFLVLNTEAYNMFLDVNIWGVCTIVKIYKNNTHNVIWEEHFLTPELLRCAKRKDFPKIISYLNTITYKRIKNKFAKLKIKRLVRTWNKNKNIFSEIDALKLNGLIFLTALDNI